VAKKAAKKKKGARKAAPRKTRKTAPRKTRATSRQTPTEMPHLSSTIDGDVTWQKDAKQVVLTPLKAIIREHISELKGIPQTDAVKSVLKALETAVDQIKASGCGLSMAFPR
jgi:hypothetical protein